MAVHPLIHSKLDYAAPAWQPWLSDTNLSCLDRLKNRSFWLITGQFVSTPLVALNLEANVQSCPTCSKCLILKARKKALRSTVDHPKRIALDANILQRLQNRSSFRQKAEELSTLLPPSLQHRQNIIHLWSPAWLLSFSHKGEIPTSVTTIASYQTDYVIYTDGSASRETRNEGAAEFVTRGSPRQPEVVTIIKTKGIFQLIWGGSSCHGLSIILDIHQLLPSFNLRTLLRRQ